MSNSEDLSGVKELISVIVPVYNIEDYLKHCLESIINQSYSNLQIILVNDGSTDLSGRICDEYASRDMRIQVMHKANGGLVTARKAGLALAKGKYIGFVDGDDYIETEFYKQLLDVLVRTDADFVHSGFLEEGETCRQVYAALSIQDIAEHKDSISILQNHVLYTGKESELWTPSIWSKLFKADFIQKCYLNVPDYQSYGEDMLVFCRCILESSRFILLPDAKYHYMLRKDSISNQWNVNRFYQESSLYHELCKLWKEYGCYKKMIKHTEKFFFFRMITCMNQINKTGLGTVKYVLPDVSILEGKRLVIYGAGLVGKNFISQLLALKTCCVVAWTDKNFQDVTYPLCIQREQLNEMDYDIIIIAVKDFKVAEEIKEELAALGIKDNKLVWIKPELNLLQSENA